MRIAVISGRYRPGQCGVAHYTHRLRSELEREGVLSTVLTDRETAAQASSADVLGVTNGWTYADMLPLALAVKRANPDLLHIQHAAGTYRFQRAVFTLPLALRAVGWRGRVVTTAHEYGWWDWKLPGVLHRPALSAALWGERRGLWDREDGFLLSGSDAVIATHPATAEVVRERLPRAALHEIPLAANVDVAPVERAGARRALRERFGWPQDARVIVFFGFLHPVKGLEYLLDAFARLHGSRPNTRLLVMGGADSLALTGDDARQYEAKLKQRTRDLGVAGEVAFTGYLPDDEASRLLSGADVGALPFTFGLSLKSGSLLALLAHGLPLVGTTHDPPVPELLELPAVRLAPPRDAAGLEGELAGLLDADRERLADAGRAFVQRFAWSAVLDQHLRVYRSVLSR